MNYCPKNGRQEEKEQLEESRGMQRKRRAICSLSSYFFKLRSLLFSLDLWFFMLFYTSSKKKSQFFGVVFVFSYQPIHNSHNYLLQCKDLISLPSLFFFFPVSYHWGVWGACYYTSLLADSSACNLSLFTLFSLQTCI